MKTQEEMPEHLKAVYGEFRMHLYACGLIAFIAANVLAACMGRFGHVVLALQ